MKLDEMTAQSKSRCVISFEEREFKLGIMFHERRCAALYAVESEAVAANKRENAGVDEEEKEEEELLEWSQVF